MSDCRHLKPKVCGNRMKPFFSNKGCGIPRFVGIEDVTINQGIGIDLTEGIHAYDGNGNEIPYTTTPDSIDMCDVGEHTVIYHANAEGRKLTPWFCSTLRGLVGGLLCGKITLRKERTVTIEQIDPPRIEGLSTIKIAPNVGFDPSEGVTAIDGNENEIGFTYYNIEDAIVESESIKYETVGEHVITYEAVDNCGNKTVLSRTVLVGERGVACRTKACGSFTACSEEAVVCEAKLCADYIASEENAVACGSSACNCYVAYNN